MTRKLLISTLMLGILLGGCGTSSLGYLAYLFMGSNPTEEVKAEFIGLENKTAAVVIFADQGVQYEYPSARAELSLICTSLLKKHVKGITVVDPLRIVKYQDENIYWDTMDKTELGSRFGADYVIYISLLEFSTREPLSSSLFRGRIIADVGVYQTSLPERQSQVARFSDISVIYPEKDPTGELSKDDSLIRRTTETLFADKLVKKFYDHEVPKEDKK